MVRRVRLYKYRSNATCQAKLTDMLRHGLFYFADWKTFNDPMEGYFQYSIDHQDDIRRVIRGKSEIKICCFSKTFDNILLWSHYANGHQGFCVEVEVDAAEDPKIVEYVPNISCLSDILQRNLNNHDDAAIKILSTKINLWEYEEEYRIFKRQSNEKNHKVGRVTRVLLGIRMDENDKEVIRKICSDVDIKLVDTWLDFDSNTIKLDERS